LISCRQYAGIGLTQAPHAVIIPPLVTSSH
jgi:hypothetical protein